MNKTRTIVGILFLLMLNTLTAQNSNQKPETSKPTHPTTIQKALHFSISKPVRDMKASEGPRTESEQKAFKRLKKEKENYLNFDMEHRSYPNAAHALPLGNDPVWQKQAGKTPSRTQKAPLLNFAGQDSPYSVSDCNGAAGPNHYMQGVNTTFAIWDKQGNQVVAPTDFNTLFEGVAGASVNDGDPIVIYDDQADRWLAAEFSGVSSNPDYMLIAISTSNDPTGTWYRWSFLMDGFPDYEKFGVWRDGYYMGTNTPGGNDIYVFERDVMLAGGEDPQMVGFANPNRPNSGFHCVEPLDNDGAFAPEGTPGQFITINDDAWGGSNDELWIFELDVDWTNTASSTFERTQTIATSAFDSNFGSSWSNIAQLGTSQKVDAVPQVLMYRAQYRNWGSSQTIMCAHTVDVDDSDHAGIRWYELENTGLGWSIRQEGTYAPDEHSRWIPSISMDANHNIALGYNVSSASMYPGIRYAGQSALENQAASGVLDIAEELVLSGTSSHSSDNRWADYAEMSVDPSDDATFWFTTEYANGSHDKSTQIVSFQFQPAVVYDNDAGTGSMVAPVSSIDLDNSETIEISLRNYGNNAISNFPVTYILNNGIPVTEIISSTVEAGEIFNYSFPTMVDLSVEGEYSFKFYTGLEGDENHNNDTTYKTIIHIVPSYCGAAGGGHYEHITKVSFGDIDNTSQQTAYFDYTNLSTSLAQGESSEIKVSLGSGYASDRGLVWVDWNHDYDFEDDGEAYVIGNGSGPYIQSIAVPNDALLGTTRMRVRVYDKSNFNSPNPTPCGDSGYGEVEDYSVLVTSTVGIKEELVHTLLQVSPNPADNELLVLNNDISIDGTLKLLDVTGKVIYQDRINGVFNKTYDVSKMANGVYFVKIEHAERALQTVKFVIQH